MTEEQMQEIGAAVNDHLPDDYGFITLTFPFNSTSENKHLYYVSTNCSRDGAMKILKECLNKYSSEENWMNHL